MGIVTAAALREWAMIGAGTALAVLGARSDGFRALWHGLGFCATLAIAGRALAPVAPHRVRLGFLVALALVCLPAAWTAPPPAAPPEPRMVNADADSDRLWSFAFQRPEQRIGRAQPVVEPLTGYELRVRLAAPYRGPARLFGAVNGVALGPLALPAEDQPDQVEAFAGVPPGALEPLLSPAAGGAALVLPLAGALGAPANVAHLVVWADTPDPALRIVVQRAHGGAALGARNSWFWPGVPGSGDWRAGVLHAASGAVRPGLWHIFIARGHVGR